jgi:gliding motility-associated lipoprotein GldH
MNKVVKWFLVVTTVILVSCKQNRVYEKYIGLESLQWKMADTLNFELDPNIVANANIIAVKHNTDYPYRNMYIRYILKDSLGKEVKNEMINVFLFESTSGKPLGKGFGGSFTKYDTLPFDQKIKFSSIHFIQFMRVDHLEGIEAIGFKRIK